MDPAQRFFLWTLVILFCTTLTIGGDNNTWVISRKICEDEDSNCSCTELNGSHTFIKCQCRTMDQVVNLEKPNETNVSSPIPTIFHLENCSNARIHPNAFGAFHGNYLEIHLQNIPQLNIMEAAFDLDSRIVTRKITFNNINIEKINTKSFPSRFNITKFIGSEIGTIASKAFTMLSLDEILFQNTKIKLIESDAFEENLEIKNWWMEENSSIDEIQSNGIKSGITNMTWTDSEIGNLQSSSMSGIIINPSFLRNIFRHISTEGLTLREWTKILFINNTFESVESGGIDLRHSKAVNKTLFIGNTWKDIGLDFIKVGTPNPHPYAVVEDNKILQLCNCSSPFIPEVTLTETNQWFFEEIQNNSMCLTTEKAAKCIGRSNFGDNFVNLDDWGLLCSEATFLCLNEFTEVSEDVVYTPPLTGRLRILAIFIGTVGLGIVLALVTVICVYMCRSEKPPNEKENPERSKGIRNGSVNPSLHVNNQTYAGILKVSQSGNRPRSTLFEDVEMEDKGVQTMPSELSNEVLEGLREKLTDPDSFWDAKETIDHLYDLIHVREDSSPPDVCPQEGDSKPQQRTRSTSTSTGIVKNPPPIRSTSLSQDQNLPPPRYAQIRSKPKASHLEYRDPSHIYSELKGNRPPVMCDYTEPKDVQTHVYAELNSFPTHINPRPCPPSIPYHNKTFCVTRPRPIGRLTTPPTVPVQDSSKATNIDSNSPSCKQRPLPSIPPPFSTSTLK